MEIWKYNFWVTLVVSLEEVKKWSGDRGGSDSEEGVESDVVMPLITKGPHTYYHPGETQTWLG